VDWFPVGHAQCVIRAPLHAQRVQSKQSKKIRAHRIKNDNNIIIVTRALRADEIAEDFDEGMANGIFYEIETCRKWQHIPELYYI
jgi:hypothetical protein